MKHLPTHPCSLLILGNNLSASWFLIYKTEIMTLFCTCLHYLVGTAFKAGARCALTFNGSSLFLLCPERDITWSISPAQKGNKNDSLGKILVLYGKVGHEGRERGRFLSLESCLALKHTFQLGVDADSSDTSTSTASCCSLKGCRGPKNRQRLLWPNYKEKSTAQIHWRTSRSPRFSHGFLSPLPSPAQLLAARARVSNLLTNRG